MNFSLTTHVVCAMCSWYTQQQATMPLPLRTGDMHHATRVEELALNALYTEIQTFWAVSTVKTYIQLRDVSHLGIVIFAKKHEIWRSWPITQKAYSSITLTLVLHYCAFGSYASMVLEKRVWFSKACGQNRAVKFKIITCVKSDVELNIFTLNELKTNNNHNKQTNHQSNFQFIGTVNDWTTNSIFCFDD